MLSLYIHIPFCNYKCKYCSFFVVPEEHITTWSRKMDSMKEQYVHSLIQEQHIRHTYLWHKQIKTLYIWWGTPFQLWPDKLFTLIDTLLDTRDTQFLEELTIELNPDPFDEVIEFITTAQKKYRHLFRLRFSFGIQTFDDTILASSKRNYVFNNLPNFLREVASIKAANTVYNLDFIAFGNSWDRIKDQNTPALPESEIKTRLPRDEQRRDFFKQLVGSQMFDGCSIYTLELFPWAEWYYTLKSWKYASSIGSAHGSTDIDQQAIFSQDPTIGKEFSRLKKTLLDAWYRRYEISNFALAGKRSLHNMVYRTWWDYLWLGINAAGMFTPSTLHELLMHDDHPLWDISIEKNYSIRYKNTTKRKSYLQHKWLDHESIQMLTRTERKSEQFMLLLRTDLWVLIDEYRDVLIQDVDHQIQELIRLKLVSYDEESTRLTLRSRGMDIYNTILLQLIKEL